MQADRSLIADAASSATSPLIVATNREPYRLGRSQRHGTGTLKQTTGGLVSALVPAVTASGGLWVAWNPRSRLDTIALDALVEHQLSLVPVSEREIADYYRGFSNSALWPLCHYAIDRCHFSVSHWRRYVTVNRRFADRIATHASPDALVWVHDYHLLLVPDFLRQATWSGDRIAYFHHIPFPAAEVFRVLPWWRDVLTGLLGADLIGFHIPEYVENFLAACRLLDGAEVCETSRTVRFRGRSIQVDDFPIGIDVDTFDGLARDERTEQKARKIRSALNVETLLVGADRLDYTKGIEQRFEAVDRLLTQWPELCGKISLLQIAVPSRSEVPEYSRFKQCLDETAGRINGKHARDGWQPIHCVYRNHSREELVAHYRAADIALVTPLRDGMNLVAQEFCASRIDDDGVLVLSEFAGASSLLPEGAVMVNPYDTDGFARTIAGAMKLDRTERQSRMRELRRAVSRNGIHEWTQNFLRLARGGSLDAPRSA